MPTLTVTPVTPLNLASVDTIGVAVTGDGVANDTSALQAAVTAAAGQILWIPEGTYRVTASISVPSSTTIQLADGAKILRDFATGGVGGATFINANQASSNTDISILGGEFGTNGAQTGKHLGFKNVTRLRLHGVRFSSVNTDWNIELRYCTDIRISDLMIDSGTAVTEDGIHLIGCQRGVISNCVIRCGDDCISLSQEGTSTTDMYDITIENCYAESRAANGIRIYVASGETAKIKRITVRGVVGKAYAQAILINDANNSSGRLSDIKISDCLFDQSANTGAGSLVYYADRVTLDNVTVQSPQGVNFDLRHLTQLEAISCVAYPGPRTATTNNISIDDVSGFRVIGGLVSGGTQYGIQIGSTTACAGGQIIGNRFDSITQHGVQVSNGSNITVLGNRFTSSGGGVNEAAPSDINFVVCNDVTGLGTTVAITGGSTRKMWNVGDATNRLPSTDVVQFGSTGPSIRTGSGTPEAAVTARIGSLYLRTDGGAATSVYVKESGTGNTGWVGK